MYELKVTQPSLYIAPLLIEIFKDTSHLAKLILDERCEFC